MKKYLYFTVVLGLLFLSASCDRKQVLYEPSEGEVAASFLAKKALFTIAPLVDNQIQVTLYRGITAGEVSVPVEIDDESELFTPDKSQFDFADGENKAVITLSFDPEELEYAVDYEIVFEIADEEQASFSGFDQTTVIAALKMNQISKGEGSYYSDWFGEAWEQELTNVQEAPSIYLLPDCYTEGTPLKFQVVDGQPVFATLINTGWLYPGLEDYGPLYLVTSSVSFSEGVISFNADYILYDVIYYKLASGVDAFELPEDFTF